MELYRHEDYDFYIAVQQRLTGKKTRYAGKRICRSFIDEDGIKKVNDLIHKFARKVRTVVCHGCRSGFEVDVLQKLNPNAKVFGTDIYGKAYLYDRSYFRQMDFDIVPLEWIGYFDVVYSNSTDHSRNPINTLMAWKSELRRHGIMFIDYWWGIENVEVSREDCFHLDRINYMEEISDIASQVGMGVLHVSSPYFLEYGAYYIDVIMGK